MSTGCCRAGIVAQWRKILTNLVIPFYLQHICSTLQSVFFNHFLDSVLVEVADGSTLLRPSSGKQLEMLTTGQDAHAGFVLGDERLPVLGGRVAELSFEADGLAAVA